MTDDSIALGELLEKNPDADLMREMIGLAAERLMALEVQGLTGAGYGERSPERLAQRNGTSSPPFGATIAASTISSSRRSPLPRTRRR